MGSKSDHRVVVEGVEKRSLYTQRKALDMAVQMGTADNPKHVVVYKEFGDNGTKKVIEYRNGEQVYPR